MASQSIEREKSPDRFSGFFPTFSWLAMEILAGLTLCGLVGRLASSWGEQTGRSGLAWAEECV
jgi:hypothetical protein